MLAFTVDEGGAVSAEHPTNPRVVRANRGKREPRSIRIENYARCDNSESSTACAGSDRGILPAGSRETTPLDDDEAGAVATSDTENMTFFSGNPFVEMTKGIIHMYKKK